MPDALLDKNQDTAPPKLCWVAYCAACGGVITEPYSDRPVRWRNGSMVESAASLHRVAHPDHVVIVGYEVGGQAPSRPNAGEQKVY